MIRVTTKGLDVGLNPLEESNLIEETIVTVDAVFRRSEEAEGTKTIVTNNDDLVLRSTQVSTVVERATTKALLVVTSVEIYHNRLVTLGRSIEWDEDVQVQAVFVLNIGAGVGWEFTLLRAGRAVICGIESSDVVRLDRCLPAKVADGWLGEGDASEGPGH